MRYTLSPEWDIQVPEVFQHRVDGEHVIFWTSGITLLCTVFSYSGEKGRETLLANLRARAEIKELQIIEEIEGEIIRFGYLQPEELHPGHHRLALHAFTTAPFGCLQTSFYLDDAAFLQDQLKIWASVRHNPQGEPK
jgi:hypothetical protein